MPSLPMLATTLAFATATPLLPAQADVRIKVEGKVVDAKGKLVAEARVVLHAEPLLPIGRDEPDRVVVTTNARGQFTAKVLLQLNYRAWAATKTSPTKHSDVVVVVPGKPCDLVCNRDPSMAVTLNFLGLDLWKPLGGLRLRLFEADGRKRPLPLTAKGSTRLPPMPGKAVVVELLHRGRMVHSVLVPLSKRRRERARAWFAAKRASVRHEPAAGLPDPAKLPVPALDVTRVIVPPPLVLPLKIIDKASSKPVRDARITWEDAPFKLLPPESLSDADGRTQLVIARRIDAWGRAQDVSVNLTVAARNYVLTRSGWTEEAHVGMKKLDPDKVIGGKAPLLEIALSPGHVMSGEVRNAKRYKASELELLAKVSASQPLTGTSWDVSQASLFATTKRRFELVGSSPATERTRLLLRLPDALCRKQKAPCLKWVDWPLPGDPLEQRLIRLDRLDLAKLRWRHVQFLLPNKRAAAFAVVETTPKQLALAAFSEPIYRAARVRTDERGRCALPWALERGWLLVHGESHGDVFEFTKKPPRRFVLRRLVTVSGRVVDSAGKAVPNARTTVVQFEWPDIESERRSVIMSSNSRFLETRTGPDGSFRIRIIPDKTLGYVLGATANNGKRALRCPAPARIGAKDIHVELRLDGPRRE